MTESVKFLYESQVEHYESYGIEYATYGIYWNNENRLVPILHDVTLRTEEAERICRLLNKHSLNPEQARYVVEDCVIESYIV